MLYPNAARAYVNYGRWVAGCPRRGCNHARSLTPGQGLFYCDPGPSGLAGCGVRAEVDWPDDASELFAELARRPIPSTRNWFPSRHELAVAGRLPHGQTVAELRNEFERYGDE